MKDGQVADNAANQTGQDVFRRQVFYLPGYDPMLPRRYRELYRTEGAKQAAISGYHLRLSGNTGGAHYSWSVKSVIDDKPTQTDFQFLLWSDIVQSSMERSIPATFVLLAKVVWIYLSTGALWRLARLRKGPVLAALYPVFMLSAQLGVAGLLALVSVWIFASFIPVWGALGFGVAVLALVMMKFRQIDKRLFAYYLLHDYAFSARYRGAHPPQLQGRMHDFAEQVYAALASDFDEVLVVGHSSGAHLAVSVLADLCRRHPLETFKPALGFLSLGHVVPMVSFLPDARQLRRDLHELSQENRLTWVDVTAPGDGCTFALVDPVAVSGVAPNNGHRWPLVISAAFTHTMSEALRASMKWRYFRIHFQYLCAFDQPGDYDYFQITAGPQTLGERYHLRAASPSCLVTPLSPFVTMSAP